MDPLLYGADNVEVTRGNAEFIPLLRRITLQCNHHRARMKPEIHLVDRKIFVGRRITVFLANRCTEFFKGLRGQCPLLMIGNIAVLAFERHYFQYERVIYKRFAIDLHNRGRCIDIAMFEQYVAERGGILFPEPAAVEVERNAGMACRRRAIARILLKSWKMVTKGHGIN